MRKSAIHSIRNVLSFKILRSGNIFVRENGFVGSRERTRVFAMIRRKVKMKPRVLVAHAKLAEVKSEESIRGNRTPPRDPAQLARPVAKPRRTLK